MVMHNLNGNSSNKNAVNGTISRGIYKVIKLANF